MFKQACARGHQRRVPL